MISPFTDILRLIKIKPTQNANENDALQDLSVQGLLS
jgi:hypothetical protein